MIRPSQQKSTLLASPQTGPPACSPGIVVIVVVGGGGSGGSGSVDVVEVVDVVKLLMMLLLSSSLFKH